MNLLSLFSIFSLFGGAVVAQSISLEDLRTAIDARAGNLDGYQVFLEDSDPARSLAALQIMLESKDDTLIRMALDFGVYSPNAAIRQTALKAYMASKPSIDLFFDGATVTEDQMGNYQNVIASYGGTIGIDKLASANFSVGDWSTKMGCYVFRMASDRCVARVNATTVSIMLPGASYIPDQWVNLTLGEEGTLAGSATPTYNGSPIGPLGITVRLSE